MAMVHTTGARLVSRRLRCLPVRGMLPLDTLYEALPETVGARHHSLLQFVSK